MYIIFILSTTLLGEHSTYFYFIISATKVHKILSHFLLGSYEHWNFEVREKTYLFPS